MPDTASGAPPASAIARSKKWTPCSTWIPPLKAGSQNQCSGGRLSPAARFTSAKCRSRPSVSDRVSAIARPVERVVAQDVVDRQLDPGPPRRVDRRLPGLEGGRERLLHEDVLPVLCGLACDRAVQVGRRPDVDDVHSPSPSSDSRSSWTADPGGAMASARARSVSVTAVTRAPGRSSNAPMQNSAKRPAPTTPMPSSRLITGSPRRRPPGTTGARGRPALHPGACWGRRRDRSSTAGRRRQSSAGGRG